VLWGHQVEAAAVRREEELKEVESREESSFRELAALKEQVFKQSQALFNLRREESQMIADIATSQASAGLGRVWGGCVVGGRGGGAGGAGWGVERWVRA
jgi:hypothetical protein